MGKEKSNSLMKFFLLNALALASANIPPLPKSYSFTGVLIGSDSGLADAVYALDTNRGLRQYLTGDTRVGEEIVRSAMVDICVGNESVLYMDVVMPDSTHQCTPMNSECEPTLHHLFDILPYTDPYGPCSTPAGSGTWYNSTLGDSVASYCIDPKAPYGTAVYYASIISPDTFLTAIMSTWSSPAANELFARPAACNPSAPRVRGSPIGSRVVATLKRLLKRK